MFEETVKLNPGWHWMGVWDWGLTVLLLHAQVPQQCCNLGATWLLKQQWESYLMQRLLPHCASNYENGT